MAFEIARRNEADYRWFRFEAPSSLLESLDHNLKIADGVLRFRIFKVDPEAPVMVPPAVAAPVPGREGREARGTGQPRGTDAPRRPPLSATLTTTRPNSARFAGIPRRRGRAAPVALLDWIPISEPER